MRTFPLLATACFALGIAVGACTVSNPDHCFNFALDPNAWCAANSEDRPYCSPCAAENNGCVAEEPTYDECPYYTTPDPETESGESGEGSETDTSGGETETGGTETGETG